MGPTGSAQMIARIRSYAKNLRQQTASALLAETELMATAIKGRTPVDTGTLRASIHVTGPEFEGKQIKTAVVAGGPASPYALIVHENLHAQHPVGQAKYIESVFDEQQGSLLQRIANRVEAGLTA